MKQEITLDTILPIDTEVVFSWRYKTDNHDAWGWNSDYGKKGQSVREIVNQRMSTGVDDKVIANIRFVSFEEYQAIVSATSPF